MLKVVLTPNDGGDDDDDDDWDGSGSGHGSSSPSSTGICWKMITIPPLWL